LVPPNFKKHCIKYSWKMFKYEEKVPPVNSEVLVLVHLKNIESRRLSTVKQRKQHTYQLSIYYTLKFTFFKANLSWFQKQVFMYLYMYWKILKMLTTLIYNDYKLFVHITKLYLEKHIPTIKLYKLFFGSERK
jgi:hypothetical protein